MAIGERIRFIRNLRGMTQKWLGQAVGFPQKTADVRMAQYESGSRTPKEDLVKALAYVLEVSPLALSIPDIDSDLGFIHTMFAIEDIHGVRAEKQGDEVHIVFDGSKRTMDESVFKMLSAWAEQAEKFRSGEISKEEYDRWRYRFPEFDTTQRWAKAPSQELSDMLVEAFKKDLK
jgi:transcriptional regulator with XRE-family HTH domain